MLNNLRSCWRLFVPGHGRRWMVVVALAVMVSAVEAGGALLVFVLLKLVEGADDALVVPVLGDLRERLPVWDATELYLVVAGTIAVFFVLRGVLVLVKAYVTHRVIENAGARLSSRLAEGYLALPYAAHLRRNSAQLVRNAHQSVDIVLAQALKPLVQTVSQGLVAVAIIAVLLATTPLPSLIAVGVLLPMAGVLLGLIFPRMKRLGRTSQEMNSATLQTLQQSLQGVRDIKVLAREGFFARQFARSRRRLARARYLRELLTQAPRVATETTMVLLIAGLFAVTVVTEGSPAGALSVLGVFAYAAFRLKRPLNTMLSSLNKVRYAGPALDDVEADLHVAGPHVAVNHQSVEPLPLRHALELRGVRFRYDGAEQDALRDIDLTIARSESVGLVGPTGGGKSTLVDVMLGLLEPTEGAVLVDGVDLRGRERAWQANLGVIAQSLFLLDDTLRRNIALGLRDADIDQAAVEEAVEVAQLDEVVNELPHGLDTVVGEGGVRLSGGQRQRVAIARALYRRPEVLVLDEGTSALDNRTEASVLARLASLHGSRTLVTVAHRLTTVRSCDRVLLIEHGAISAAGTYEDLAKHDASFHQLAAGDASAHP